MILLCMDGVEIHSTEYNGSDRASGAWGSNELLTLALFLSIGELWKYSVVNFSLKLGKRSFTRSWRMLHYSMEGTCVSAAPPIKRSVGSRALWHHRKWPLSLWKQPPIPAFCRSYKSTSRHSITGYATVFMDVSQKIMFWFLGTWSRSLWEESNVCSY